MKQFVILLSLSLVQARILYAQSTDSLGTSGWHSVLSPSLPIVDTTYRSSGQSYLALDFERQLSLNRWGSSVLIDRYGARDEGGYQLRSEARSVLREGVGSITTETSNILTAAIRAFSDGLFLAFSGYGASYHTGPPKGLIIVNDPNTRIDGFAAAGPEYRFGSNSVAQLLGGVSRQSELSGGVLGQIYRGYLHMPEIAIADEHISTIEFKADERFYNDRSRHTATDRLSLSTRSNFEGGITNYASIDLGYLARDFFFSARQDVSPYLQRRSERSLSFVDRLYLPQIMSGTDLRLSIEYAPRVVERRTDDVESLLGTSAISSLGSLVYPNEINSSRFLFDGAVVYTNPFTDATSAIWNVEVGARYEEHDEVASVIASELPAGEQSSRASDLLEQASYNSSSTQLNLKSVYQPFRDHHILGEFTARIFRHSTPSSDNFDDRDDQLMNARIAHIASFDEWGLLTELRVSRSHLVYLSANRSAQNAETESITLSNTTNTRYPGLQNMIRSEVFAYYTVLDYHDRLPQLQAIGNYLIRGLSIRDSMQVVLSSTIGVNSTLFLEGVVDARLNERGSYDPQKFTERRVMLISETGAELSVGLRKVMGRAPLSVRAGVRAFEFRREGPGLGLRQEWMLQDHSLRWGPLVSVTLEQLDEIGSELYGALWYAFNSSSSQAVLSRTQQVEGHLGVRWRM